MTGTTSSGSMPPRTAKRMQASGTRWRRLPWRRCTPTWDRLPTWMTSSQMATGTSLEGWWSSWQFKMSSLTVNNTMECWLEEVDATSTWYEASYTCRRSRSCWFLVWGNLPCLIPRTRNGFLAWPVPEETRTSLTWFRWLTYRKNEESDLLEAYNFMKLVDIYLVVPIETSIMWLIIMYMFLSLS